MASHRRLVVPQLGAFMAKPDGSIVFSELLRTDDGALRGALCADGMGELEAAGAIDRFVFEVRHAVQSGESYTMAHFGTFMAGPNATMLFAYDPQSGATMEEDSASNPAVELSPMHPPRAAVSEAKSIAPGEPMPTPGQTVVPHSTPSMKMQPEPYVKGLRYGKPEKTTNAYTYVHRAPRRKGFDKLLLLAVVAAVIALAVIAYGSIREYRAAQDSAPVSTEQIEQSIAPAAGDDAIQLPENK